MSTKATIHSVAIETKDVTANLHIYHEVFDESDSAHIAYHESTDISSSSVNFSIPKELWAKLVAEIEKRVNNGK